MSFVKSADTSVPASRSQAELERVLRRYGASSFSVANHWDRGEASVAFRIPESPGSATMIPVELRVRFGTVAELLRKNAGPRSRKKLPDYLPQAERVAWRHLVLWVDATLTAVTTGLQTVSEAFLAQTLIDGGNGKTGRVYDLFVEGGGAKLLAAGAAR